MLERGVAILLNLFPALPSPPFPLASAIRFQSRSLKLITFPDIGRFLGPRRAERVEVGRSVCVRLCVCTGCCGSASAGADPSTNFGEATSPGK